MANQTTSFTSPLLSITAFLKDRGNNTERWASAETSLDAAATILVNAVFPLLVLYLICQMQRHIQFVQKVNALPGASPKELHAVLGHFKLFMDTIGTIPNRPELPNAIGWFLQHLPTYKKDGLVRFWMFHPYYMFFTTRASLFLLDPFLIQQLLTKKQCYEKLHKEERLYKMASCLVGSSFLAMPDGPVWKHQRKMVAPAFNAGFLQQVHDTVIHLLEQHFFPYYDVKDSNNMDDGAAHPNLLEAMDWSGQLTLDVIGTMSFSQDFGGWESFAAFKKRHDQQQVQASSNVLDDDNEKKDTLYSTYVTILLTIALCNKSPVFHNQFLF
ncbi:hypothetical protein ACA910_008938 [Epithemia clementina (nom. ined.)]